MEEQPREKRTIMQDIEETTERVRGYPLFLRTASSAARVERDRRKREPITTRSPMSTPEPITTQSPMSSAEPNSTANPMSEQETFFAE